MNGRRPGSAINGHAADWAARIDRGGLNREEQGALDGWLAADIRHQGALYRALAVLRHYDRAGAFGSSQSLLEFAPQTAGNGSSFKGVAMTRRRIVLAAAGGLAVAAGVAIPLLRRPRVFETGIGEVLHVPFPDGSAATLDTASRIAIDFTRRERRVRLEAGKALFQVASDPGRPFRIEANATLLQAYDGCTAVAQVDEPQHRTVVTVVNGAVDMLCAGARPVRLLANTETQVPARQGGSGFIPAALVRTRAVSQQTISRELSWRSGLLSFDQETVSGAAAQFARYSTTRILVPDPGVASQHIVGVFFANDPVGFARAVARSLRLRVEVDGGDVVLRPANAT